MIENTFPMIDGKAIIGFLDGTLEGHFLFNIPIVRRRFNGYTPIIIRGILKLEDRDITNCNGDI